MGSIEEHLGENATSIVLLGYQLRDLWRSPRGTVVRIEALTLVAITLSFFLGFFGSCRRWSNRWIVQKGFLAAQVLSLSIGTYSIGLMQSSPVKSEMYPIWAVSLLTLFGCIDPVTTYIELDYKGPLLKMIFQLCLYFGYVMLMGVSSISSDIGKLAIGVLSIITFIKSFHRSLVFMLPGQIRQDMKELSMIYGFSFPKESDALAGNGKGLIVHLPLYLSMEQVKHKSDLATMEDIQKLSLPKGTPANGKMINEVCLSYSLSHLLRERFLGLDKTRAYFIANGSMVWDGSTIIDYKQALKIVEVELAFLFEAFFTSNEFLHFYQAKTGCFWALASLIGICFVGVVFAIIPGAMASHHSIVNSAATAAGAGAGTSVGITTVDIIITLVILVSMALLQLVQLMWCWTSNWARVGIACQYAFKEKKQMSSDEELSGSDINEVKNDDLEKMMSPDEELSDIEINEVKNGDLEKMMSPDEELSDIEINGVKNGDLEKMMSPDEEQSDIKINGVKNGDLQKVMSSNQELSNIMIVPAGGGDLDEMMSSGKELSCHSNTRSSCNNQIISRWVMGLRLFLVARVNWSDKYLWQARLGQDSLAELLQRRRTQDRRESVLHKAACGCHHCPRKCNIWLIYGVGVLYFRQALGALLLSDTSNPGGAVRLHDDVKASIAEFLGTIKSRRIGVEWSTLFVENGLQDWLEYLPYKKAGGTSKPEKALEFTVCVMIWHIATWYCQEADKAAGDSSSSREKNRRVAMDLSKYCTYLVVSAPELLPGSTGYTKGALSIALETTEEALQRERTIKTILEVEVPRVVPDKKSIGTYNVFLLGVCLGKRLRNDAMTTPLTATHPEGSGRRIKEDEEQSTRCPCSSDHWELLARLWVQTLLYAAPYGDMQVHMQRLAQGGEFITHLWALLYHLGIDRWEVEGTNELKGRAAAETTTEVQVEEDAGRDGEEIE